MKGLTEEQYLAEIAIRDQENAALKIEVKLLREKINALVKKVFGSSSEKLDSHQLSLFGLNEENVPGKSVASSNNGEATTQSRVKRSQLKRKGIPDHLPVVEEIIEPTQVQTAPDKWRYIGEEVSEQLDYQPGRFFKRRLVRRRYVSKQDKEAPPVIAPLPGVILERSQIAPGLLAHIVVSKYCNHVPLYRQEQIYARQDGVWLPRQKMDRWVGVGADWVRPIYDLIRTEVLGSAYLQIDETPIRYLDPGNGVSKQGYLWTVNRPRGNVFYQWEPGRGKEELNKVIRVNFTGTLQVDGYVVYESYGRDNPQIKMAGCLAHVRRKFHESLEYAPQVAGWILRQIGHLYRIEEELRKIKAGPKLRAAVRAREGRMIHTRLFRLLERLNLSGRILPRSKLGQAIRYTLNLQMELGVYLEQGEVEVDNNLVENAIRPTAVGKKNWLFIGSVEAGQQSAILFTIVECCRRQGIDPYAYLKDVFTRLPNSTNHQVKDLTPEAWAKAQKNQPLQLAA